MLSAYTFYSYQLRPDNGMRNPRVTPHDCQNARKGEKGQKEKKRNKFKEFFNKIFNFGSKITIFKNIAGTNMLDRYKLGRELGRGISALTYLCIDRQSGKKFACKSVSKRKIREESFDIRTEVKIMQLLPAHRNLIGLKAIYEDNRSVHLIMELCEGGELYERIITRGYFPEKEVVVMAKSILEMVQICHKSGVIHRDLKPENLLFMSKNENAELKLIDFGLSVFFKPGQTFYEKVGTTYYMAPEIIKRKYGCQVDIWSSGVILYVLLCGYPPFIADSEKGIEREILKAIVKFEEQPWPQVSERAKDLIRKMLHPDPSKRITADQALRHPWFKMINKKAQDQ